MATHGRQQYFADEASLQKESREFSIADEVQQKIDGIEDGAQVNVIEEIRVNGQTLTPDQDKAVDITVPDVIDSLSSVSITDALSANQGKVLYDYITNIASRGRFLSNWNCATGLPVTNPVENPYAYKAGDYYSVSNVATSPAVNYRPDGSQYVIGQASTTVETDDVNVSDFYLYDGTNWLLLVNTARQITIDSSLSTTSTNPVENRVVTNALNGKQDTISDLATIRSNASAGKSASDTIATYGDIVTHDVNEFATAAQGGLADTAVQPGDNVSTLTNDAGYVTDAYHDSTKQDTLVAGTNIQIAADGVTISATDTTYVASDFDIKDLSDSTGLRTEWSGKQDELIAGTNIQIAADGKTISSTDTIYSAGVNVSISNNNVISATDNKAEWGNITGTLADQTDLQNALNSKANASDVNTRTFYIASTSDTAGMQRVTNYLDTGNNPIVDYGDAKYTLYAIRQEGTNLVFYFYALSNDTGSGTKDNLQQSILIITKTSGGAYSMTTSNFVLKDTFLSKTNTTSYTPTGNYNPATKKYVDDQVSAATAGAVSDTAYGSSWDGVTGIAPSKNAVYDKISTMDTAISGNTSAISTINGKIPSAASTTNQLADKNYVDDSINQVAAYYITKNAQGDAFATKAELTSATTFYSGGVARTPTRNDYCIALADETHSGECTRYSYQGTQWEYQYTVNETALTQQQVDALNSGITSAKVSTYDTAVSTIAGYGDIVTHNASEFATSAQGGKADTALQPNDDISELNNDAGYITGVDWGDVGGTLSNQVDLQNALNAKANDDAVVKLTGAQTIAGTKTFSTSPAVPSKTTDATNTGTAIATEAQVYKKQDKLVSGTNIKTVNNNSLLGSGNLTLNDVKVSATAPSSPTEGMVWYDTANDQLKVYDGTNWNVTGKEYNAGTGIEIGDSYSAMRGPAPSGYHVPLRTEWKAVRDIRVALGGGSSDGTNFGIALKLPFAGYRYYSSAGVSYQGSNGLYWSSSRYNTNYAYILYFYSTALTPQNTDRCAYGFSVRCFKNSPVIPTSSWTKLYGTSIESGGIFWSSTDGLISLSSDGQTWITIADKNLGATTVWNSGDTLSEANCGYYYQRGNNYGFPRTGSVTTSSTQVDASAYGPGNYYSSSTFITYNGGWDTTDNGNLRGGVTGVITDAITNTGVLSVNGQTGDVITHSTTTVTLTAAGWSSNEQTVSATGVTSSNTVIVSPAPSSIGDYADGGVYASAQGSGTLTFSCDTEPTSDITVNVLIMS